MYGISSPYLQPLKEFVVFTSGVIIKDASDCALIKQLIEDKTQSYISEITIQRLYGFVPSNFHPSLHTLNILASYCDYKDWKNFCDRQLEGYKKNADQKE